jgi:hypothetical protein
VVSSHTDSGKARQVSEMEKGLHGGAEQVLKLPVA